MKREKVIQAMHNVASCLSDFDEYTKKITLNKMWETCCEYNIFMEVDELENKVYIEDDYYLF